MTIIERLPDEVQQDHWDWGFRLSPLFGETYRYTTAFGIFSDQLQKWNKFAGFDVPMAYGELYLPWLLEGTNIRFGRYISLPDIEAQLAPNNYMYSHSMTYGFDNYTNTGVVVSQQVNKNIMLQFGVSNGTEATFWNARQQFYPPVPGGVLYQPVPGVFATTTAQSYYQGQVDPGVKPTFTACGRYQTDSAYDNLYICANGLNTGTYGYNNLQWYGFTYYHKFDELWHIAIEFWHMHENNVPNVNSFVNQVAGGLTTPNPFYYQVNAPAMAQCPGNPNPTCTAREWSTVAYLNYRLSPLDNISWRAEYFDDINGQRTGTKTVLLQLCDGLATLVLADRRDSARNRVVQFAERARLPDLGALARRRRHEEPHHGLLGRFALALLRSSSFEASGPGSQPGPEFYGRVDYARAFSSPFQARKFMTFLMREDMFGIAPLHESSRNVSRRDGKLDLLACAFWWSKTSLTRKDSYGPH